MPIRQHYLIAAPVLANDRAALRALQDLSDYAPRNPELGTTSLVELEAALRDAETEAERARLALDSARHGLIRASWAFHENIVRAKAEVITQFGADSQAVHAIGLKRKSERKRAIRRQAASAD